MAGPDEEGSVLSVHELCEILNVLAYIKVQFKMPLILLQKPPCRIHGNVIEFRATYHIHAQIFHQGVKIKERGKH